MFPSQQMPDHSHDPNPLSIPPPESDPESVAVVAELKRVADAGELQGIAYVALLGNGRIVHGYTGETLEEPELTAGMLQRVIFKLLSRTG